MSKIGKRAILILLALPIGFNVMAQEIKKLTLEDLIPGGRDLPLCRKPLRSAMVGRRVYQTEYRHHLHCSTQNRERDSADYPRTNQQSTGRQ